MTTLHLTVGLPGAGKTTRARALERDLPALRLTPDEWMIPLFDDNDADGKRDVLEGRLLGVALDAVRLSTNVVLDFGCWSREERMAIRALTEQAGGAFVLEYLPIDHLTQLDRVAHRQATAPESTFPITEDDLLGWRAVFTEPDADELAAAAPDQPPPGWTDWHSWAADRWPSFG